MAIIYSKAPGKIILFGEHAVVYGQPGIAIPVTKVNASVHIYPTITGTPEKIHIQAPDIGLDADLGALPDNHPIALAVLLSIDACSPISIPSFTLQVTSTIPMAAGMGSGAAVSTAIIQAISSFLGKALSKSELSDLTYQVEKIHHGTPSGIDNAVIAYQKPVYFLKDHPIQFLRIEQPTHWIIADTGETTPTHETVQAVRELYFSDEDKYGVFITKIGEISKKARQALTIGDIPELGQLMDENQVLLAKLSVSSPRLEILTQAAREAGAAGAKLSGGGRGGQMIALAHPEQIKTIENALYRAGAARVITTFLNKSGVE